MRKIILFATFIFVFVTAFLVSTDTVSAGASVTNQSAFRWRDDDGDEAGATWTDTENTSINDVSISNNIRLRIEAEETNSGNFKFDALLEFSSDASSCTTGSWAALDTSTTAWQIYDSSYFTGPITTSTSRLTTSAETHTAGELNDTVNLASQVTIDLLSTEHEWSIRGVSASYSQNYYFRVTDNGATLGSYGNCALLTTEAAPITYTQNDWILYVDNDANTPADVWGNPDLAENQSLYAIPPSNDPVDLNDELRLRMNMTIGGAQLDANTEGFILQYGEGNDCTAITAWTDVAAAAGGTIWEFADSTVSDNASMSATLLGTSDRAGRYSKSDPTTTNPAVVLQGEDLEWDWHVEYVDTTPSAATYCFRMRRDTPEDFNTYNTDSYPQVDIRPTTEDLMRHGSFFTSGTERGLYWVD